MALLTFTYLSPEGFGKGSKAAAPPHRPRSGSRYRRAANEREAVQLVSGTIIAESIRSGAVLDVALKVRQIRRGGPERLSAEQEAVGIPLKWTLIEFEIDDGDALLLANALADVLDDTGWYVDFRSDQETFVVFARQVFRYPRGDKIGRAEAESHGRSLGVPEAQLDWPE